MVLEKLQIIIDADGKGAQRELEKVGKSAERELGKAETGIAKTGKKLESLGTSAVLGGAVLVGGLAALAMASDDADKQVLKLENSIKNSSNTYSENGKALTDLAADLQQVTAADGDAIVGAESLLVQMGLTEDQVKSLTPLVVDLSRKMGIDLETAAKAVGKSATGSTTALKKMGIDVASLGVGSTDAEKTLSALRQTVGGFAQQEGATFSGQLERLKNNLGDIGESVGKGAAGVLGGFTQGAADATAALNKLNPGILTAVGGVGATAGIVATTAGGFALAAGKAIAFRDAVKSGDTALTKLGEDGKQSLSGVGKAAAGIAIIGAVAGIVETVATVANSINDIDKKTASAFDGLRSSLTGTSADAADAFGTLVEVEDKSAEFAGIWQGFGAEIQLGGFKADIEEVDAAFTKVLDTLGPEAAQKVIDGLRAQNEALDKNSDQYKTNSEFIADSQKRIDDRREATVKATIAEREQKRATQEAVDAYDRETGTLEGVTASIKEYQGRLKLLTTEYDASSAAAKGFAEQIERSTVKDDQIGAAISYNEAFKKFADTAKDLPRTLDAAQTAIDGIGDSANTVGEEAVQAFLAVGDQARTLLSSFIQAGDEQGAIALAGRLRDQISAALAAQGMNPDQINQFLELSGLTDVQVSAAIKFGNIEAELLRVQTLINLFQTQLQDAPPELLLKIDDAIVNNDLQKAGDLIRGWIAAKGTDPATSQIGIDAIIASEPDLKPVIDRAQLAADNMPVRIPVTVGDVTVDLDPSKVLPSVDANKEKLYNIDLNGNGIIGKAIGGPVTDSTPYIVGESGPELFVPNTSGKIVPNNQLQSQQMNLTQNIYSSDPILSATEAIRQQRDAAFLVGV